MVSSPVQFNIGPEERFHKCIDLLANEVQLNQILCGTGVDDVEENLVWEGLESRWRRVGCCRYFRLAAWVRGGGKRGDGRDDRRDGKRRQDEGDRRDVGALMERTLV